MFACIFSFIYHAYSQGVNSPLIQPVKDIALNQKFTFYKKGNPKKIFRIKSGKEITIWSKDSLIPPSLANSKHYSSPLYGRLYSKNDSMLFLYSVHISATSFLRTPEITYSYSKNSNYPVDSIIGIKFKDIRAIYYRKPEMIAKVILICFPLSVISGLIVAPASSIDLAKGTVNSQLYSDILYPSIGVFTVGFITFAYEFGNHNSTVALQATR